MNGNYLIIISSKVQKAKYAQVELKCHVSNPKKAVTQIFTSQNVNATTPTSSMRACLYSIEHRPAPLSIWQPPHLSSDRVR